MKILNKMFGVAVLLWVALGLGAQPAEAGSRNHGPSRLAAKSKAKAKVPSVRKHVRYVKGKRATLVLSLIHI